MNFWIFTFSIIGNLYNNAHCFYKDYTNVLNVSSMGKVRVNYYIKFATFKNVPYQNCDEGYVWPYYACDVEIRHYIIIPFGYKSREDYDSFTKYISEIIFKHEPFHMSKEDQWDILMTDISDQGSFYRDNVNELHNVAHNEYYTTYYRFTIGLCSKFWDADMYGQRQFLIEFCDYKYFPLVNFEQSLRGRYDATNTQVHYIVKPYCHEHHFGISCWKACHPVPERSTCNQEGDELCLGYFDSIYFTYNYEVPQDYFGSFQSHTTISPKCIFYNICHTKPLLTKVCTEPDFECYPLENDSHTCLKLIHFYLASKYSPDINVTFRSVLNGELVIFGFNLTGSQSSLVTAYSKGYWWFDKKDRRHISFNNINNESVLEIFSNSEFGSHSFEIRVVVGQFRHFTYYMNLVVHVLPNIMEIFNSSVGSGKSLYIGQYIICRSDAIPQNISRHLISLRNIDDTINETLTIGLLIQLNITFQYCIVLCRHTFYFTCGRPPFDTYKMFFRQIRSYIYFHWLSLYKNVYIITDVMGCVYFAYFQGRLTVKQIFGPRQINTHPPENFSTFVTFGGSYRLICNLVAKNDFNIGFFKSLTFEIFFAPTFSCFVPFIPNPGALIICGHDGYPEDHAMYSMAFFVDGKEISFRLHKSIRISYHEMTRKMTIVCDISFVLGSDIKNFHLKKEFYVTTGMTMSTGFKLKDQMCLKLAEFNPDQKIVNLGSELIIMGDLLTLELPPLWPIHAWTITFFMVSFFGLLTVPLFRRNSVDLRIEYTIYCIKNRNLNSHLMSLSKLACDGKMEKMTYVNMKMADFSTFDDELFSSRK